MADEVQSNGLNGDVAERSVDDTVKGTSVETNGIDENNVDERNIHNDDDDDDDDTTATANGNMDGNSRTTIAAAAVSPEQNETVDRELIRPSGVGVGERHLGQNGSQHADTDDHGGMDSSADAVAVVPTEDNDKTHDNNKPPSLPTRPIKRARTAYFIFAEEMRPKVQKENPGEGVAHMARRIGQQWAQITPEEKERYQQMAAEERRRVAEQVEAYYHAANAGGGGGTLTVEDGTDHHHGGGPHDLTFPVARIRKICKLDPEVKNLSKEALFLVVKCAELATTKLGRESVKVARLQNRRKLLPDDVAHVCNHREPFLFLKDDVKDLVVALKEERANGNSNTNNNNNKLEGDGGDAQHNVGDDGGTGRGNSSSNSSRKDGLREAAAAGSKPLTSYFGTSSTTPK